MNEKPPVYWEGYNAFNKEIKYDDNPYDNGRWFIFRDWWNKGWTDAQKEFNLFN